ncbi:MAG: glycoside hydrolase family 10 protein [Planctomycetota bacterium]
MSRDLRASAAKALAALPALAALAGASPASAGEARIALVHDESRRDKWVEEQFARMKAVLAGAGRGFAEVTGAGIERGGLSRARYDVAVLPYCPGLSPAARAWLDLFAADGGRLVVFYDPLGLEKRLGLARARWTAKEFDGQFAEVRFTEAAPPGSPPAFRQSSWNVRAPSPAPGAEVIAWWHDREGRRTRHAAASISPGGMFFSHILLTDDARSAGAFMDAAISRLEKSAAKPQPAVAIVRGTLTERASPQGDGKAVEGFCETWRRAFESGGVGTVTVTDEMAAAGALSGRALAVMPLNHTVSAAEVRALGDYVRGGGKLVMCFNKNPELARLVGAEVGGFTSGAGGRFASMHLKAAPGELGDVLPDSLTQNAWNAFASRPAPGAAVLYEWVRGSGDVDPLPAVVISANGAYMSSPLFGEDASANGAFALGLYLRLCGAARLREVLDAMGARLWEFRRYRAADEFRGGVRKLRPALLERLRDVERDETRVRGLLARDDPSDADLLSSYSALRRARSELEGIFIEHASSPQTELRAVWCHAPSMADWDATFRTLAGAGFNAFIPNMCHARDAFYPSLYLKPSKKLPGDRMTPMLDAAARHEIEVHVWKVNWNLWWHDRADYEALVRAGRIAVDRKGNVAAFDVAFLCPSHPENRRLEVDSMLEIVERFPRIAGIHFDYIRYRGPDYCYCGGCRERFEAATGARVARWPADALEGGARHAAYLDFRREQITRVVREVSTRARAMRRDIKLSAAVFRDWKADRDRIGQDTARWIEEGLLDFVCPMNYTADAGEFRGMVARQVEMLKGLCSKEGSRARDVRYAPGIGAFRIGAAWEIADQIMIAREGGADGFVLFDYREGGAPLPYLSKLKAGPLRERARTPWAR